MSDSKQNTGFIILITIVATIGGFLFGYDSGVINGTVDGLKAAFNTQSIGTGFNVASMLLGCALGAFIAGRAADLFGRKSILIISSILFMISALGAGIAPSSIIFIFFRLIGGLAVGAASVLAPAYISEIAPAEVRGRLSSIQQIAIIFGLFLSFLINYLIAKSAGSALNDWLLGFAAWRWMFWMLFVPAFLFFVALLTIPESPRFLVSSGRKDSALAVLTKLFGENVAKAKFAEIQSSLAADHRPSLKDLLDPVKGGIRPLVWFGIGLAAFQQFVGINIIFYYGAVLWQSVGFTESDSLLINVIGGAVSIAACVVATSTIDRIGRKPMLLIGSIGMAVTLGIMAIIFFNANLDAAGKLVLIGMSGPVALVAGLLYQMFFNFSWGPVMWVMLGEMFPNQMRGSGLAVSGLSQWIANFAITMTFPLMLTGIGLGKSYAIYGIFAVISFFFVLKFAHETKGIELEKMQG